MATAIRILRWKATNLRCPDHEVSFERENNETYPITLLQMPNGTGKTTTLNLLRAALSGEAHDWPMDHISSYRKRGVGNGEFQVVLLHDRRRLTITLRFDFSEGIVRYQTTIGSSGLKEGFHPPPSLQKYLRKDFVRFFVFDGEFAHRLLDHGYANAQSVIEELFQIKTFTSVAHEVAQYWEKQTSRSGATEEKGYTRRKNRVEYLGGRITKLNKERDEYRRQRDRVKATLARHRNKFHEAIETHQELAKRLRDAESHLAMASKATEAATQSLMAEFRNPHALSSIFAREILEFKASLDRVKLPESTAREFFEELAQEDTCVCGTPLNQTRRATIRARASRYLGTDDVALLNAIKSDVADLIGETPSIHEERFLKLVIKLQECGAAESAARTTRDAIETEGVGKDPGLERAQDEIGELENNLRSLQDLVERYDDRDDTGSDEQTFGIAILQRRLDDAERKLAQITETLVLKQKRDVLVQILRSAPERARKAISEQLTAEANKNLHVMMPHNAVRIQEVNRFLVLEDKQGASVGETLAVAYSFISTLLSRGEQELPFIIDSPANPIDLHVRPKVAELIPHLARQFIAFIISSERQGFVLPLEKAAKGNVQHITLFRKGPVDMEKNAKKDKGCHETSDGIAVYGRSFFHGFHGDQE